jgi:HEAT repeat protein
MRAFMKIVAVIVLSSVAMPAMASESLLPPYAKRNLVEDNLLVGLASDNLGLQRGSALMLGQIEAERAVIPLMAMLHENADANLRVAAAWALCRIGDARGVFAVRRAVKFDPSQKVRDACAWYYDTYVKHGTFEFQESTPVQISDAR